MNVKLEEDAADDATIGAFDQNNEGDDFSNNNLVKQSKSQAEMLGYPLGCHVWYNFSQESNSNNIKSTAGLLFSTGTINSVAMDADTRRLIINVEGTVKNENILEGNLAYPSHCSVRVKKGTKYIDGEIICASPVFDVNGCIDRINYSVILSLGGNRRLVLDSVPGNHIRLKKVETENPQQPESAETNGRTGPTPTHVAAGDDAKPSQKSKAQGDLITHGGGEQGGGKEGERKDALLGMTENNVASLANTSNEDETTAPESEESEVSDEIADPSAGSAPAKPSTLKADENTKKKKRKKEKVNLWECTVCTFRKNKKSRKTCKMCGQKGNQSKKKARTKELPPDPGTAGPPGEIPSTQPLTFGARERKCAGCRFEENLGEHEHSEECDV